MVYAAADKYQVADLKELARVKAAATYVRFLRLRYLAYANIILSSAPSPIAAPASFTSSIPLPTPITV